MNIHIKQLLVFLAAALLFFFMGWQVEQYAHRPPDTEDFAKVLEKRIHQAETDVEHVFRNASFLMSAISGELNKDSIDQFQEKPYTLLIYDENDSLLYWQV